MSRASFRRLAVVLAATVGVAACGADAVSPLPVQPPGPTSSTPAPAATSAIAAPTASPSRPPPTSGRPPAAPPTPSRTRGTPRTTSPPTAAATPACQGAVRYDLPLAETEIELLRSLCFATGAVLRIQGIGPGLVTVDRPELVSQQYEAGVVDVRFVRTGTVAVTIPKEGRDHTITVVVR
ncbi:hypothetical protein [Micromonospora sp. MH99]|uniref:hypothetical protein n=1 Tax=Micromonospora sp. MH99 TaxID=1945510 RepID=UPI001F3B3F8C|nr:hypothetical protein [Micromonospora sp. MH99]MCF0093674.1 hypothetical protein [Micromonospora sp. MH99]